MITVGQRRYPVYRCTGTNERGTQCGTAIKEEILDLAVKQEIRAIYASGLADSLPTADDSGPAIVAMRGELGQIAEEKAQNLRLLRAGAYTEAELIASSKELNARADQLNVSIQRRIEESAHASMLLEAVQETLAAQPEDPVLAALGKPKKGKHASITEAAEIGKRFDRLSLTQRRLLIRSLLTIHVDRGRGPDRIKITRKGKDA
jgi:hypothetical protein